MRKLAFVITILAMLALAVAPTFAQDDPGTIADIVVASASADPAEFTVLLAAVQAADPEFLTQLSNPDQQLTVFAPTDAAFAAAFEALGVTPEDVLGNEALLDTILAYHVVPGAFDSTTLVEAGSDYYIGTIFPDAPLYFAASDEGVTINESNVVAADVMASNGVIHVIDAVLVPADLDAKVAMMEEAMGMEEGEDMGTIADIASATEGFATLLTAVGAADPAVGALLSNPDAVMTVFAPTDEAFAAVPADTLQAALADQALLTSILAYHVIPGMVTSNGVVALAEANEGSFDVLTYAGWVLTIEVSDAGVSIGGAPLVTPDVFADNGVAHVIGAVILPPAE